MQKKEKQIGIVLQGGGALGKGVQGGGAVNGIIKRAVQTDSNVAGSSIVPSMALFWCKSL